MVTDEVTVSSTKELQRTKLIYCELELHEPCDGGYKYERHGTDVVCVVQVLCDCECHTGKGTQ